MSVLIGVLFFSMAAYCQIAGFYWVPVPDNYNYGNIYISDKLELNTDGTYRCYWGICLVHHEEYGTYTVNKDTVFFTKTGNRCTTNFPHQVDSTVFRLNDQNLFVVETVTVTKYDEHSCNPLNLSMLFYYNHQLYVRKLSGDPFHGSQKATYTSKLAEKRMYKDLESDATMLLLQQELGVY